MNTNPMRTSPVPLRSPTRLRRYAAAAGALVLAGTLALSGLVAGGGISDTEAAWTDTDHAQAAITAEWPEAFASVVAGSAKSSDSAQNGLLFPPQNITYEASYRWTQRSGDAVASVDTTSPDPGSNEKFLRTLDRNIQGAGIGLSDTAPYELVNSDGSIDTVTNAMHNWPAVTTFNNPGTRTPPSSTRCSAINLSATGTIVDNPGCGFEGSVAAARNTTDAFGFSISTSNAFITFLNSANLETAVSCQGDSAYAAPPTGRVDVGTEQGATNPYLSYVTFGQHVRTVWAAGQERHPNGFDLDSGEISDMWNIGAVLGIPTDPYVRVMPVITQYESKPGAQPYALSEIGAYVEVFNSYVLSSDELRAKMYFVLSRSECGVKRVGDSNLPRQRPVFPAEMPGGNGLTPYEGGRWEPNASTPAPLALNGLPDDEPVSVELPPMTTATSPREHTTPADTTTSGPPNPDGDDDETGGPGEARPSTGTTTPTTTTTKTTTTPTDPPTSQSPTPTRVAPTTVAPVDPGRLPSTARLEDVGTVEIDGDATDAVVRGTTVPDDAPAGVEVLDAWINDTIRPRGAWEAVTADDPAETGWRWAAVNRTTGTVVYIR